MSLLQSCKKESIPDETEPEVTPWIQDSLNVGGEGLLSTVVINDSILGVASSGIFWRLNVKHLNSGQNDYYVIGGNNPFPQSPPTLTNKIGVGIIDLQHLNLFSTVSMDPGLTNIQYSPGYSGAPGSNKSFPGAYATGTGYPVLDSKYILVPKEMDYQLNRAYFSLLSVDAGSEKIVIQDDKHLTLTPDTGTLSFVTTPYYSGAFYSKFFVYFHGQFYRLDTLGNVKSFGHSPVKGEENGRVEEIFKIGKYLITSGIGKMFVSDDEGETWRLFLDRQLSSFPYLNFLTLGDEAYASYRSQIWRVSISGNTLQYQELDNTGLKEMNLITSISKLGGYVFLTTSAGLYYKDAEEFHKLKIVE